MKTAVRFVIPAAMLLAALLVTGGCEETDLTAPNDGLILLEAEPRTFNLNPNDPSVPRDTGGAMLQEVRLFAEVFDDAGRTLEGVQVTFAADAGQFLEIVGDLDGDGFISRDPAAGEVAQTPQRVQTDVRGRATTTLLVDEETPDNALTAAVRSAALEATVDISYTKEPPIVNSNPLATISAVPPQEAPPGRLVTFDGSQSQDPDDGDRITNWKWVIDSDNPDPDKPDPETIEGPQVQGVQREYQNPQRLTVTLTVRDGRGGENFDVLQYRILPCVGLNTPPTAEIAGGEEQSIFGAPGQPVTKVFDGTLSSDEAGETPNDQLRYIWNCDGAFTQSATGGFVTCRWIVQSTAQVYQVSLAVEDRGVDDSGECVETSEEDIVNFTVGPIQ